MKATIIANRRVRLLVVTGLILAALVSPLPGFVRAATAVPAAAGSPSRSILAHTDAVPLAFEPNRGQTDPRVRFLAHAGGSTIFLTERGIVIASTRPATTALAPRSRVLAQAGHAHATSGQIKESVVQLLPIGAATQPRIVASNRLPGIVNYLIGHRSETNIPTYAAVTYQNIYPGIDLAIQGSRTGFEYRWIVRPGADVSKIALRIEGTKRLALDAGGDVRMQTALGVMLQQRPALYQTVAGQRQTVQGGFRLAGSTLRLWVGRHNAHLPLVIDPAIVTSTQTLLYSTYLGGSSYETGSGIAVNAAGDAFIAGYTDSTDFPICPDNSGMHAYCSTHAGSPVQSMFGGGTTDAFVAELDPTGTQLIFSTYLGGTGQDSGAGIVLDAAGDVFVTGGTASTDFPICPDSGGTHAYCSTHAGSPVQSMFGGGATDAFVAELNPTGTQLIYSTYLGGSSREVGLGIALDSMGDAFITGTTSSTDFPVCPDNAGTHAYCASHSGSAVQSTFVGGSGGTDAFVTGLNPTGTAFIYSTYLGGSSIGDSGQGIAVDAAGDAYVTGWTDSTAFPICPDNGGTHAYCASHAGNPVQSAFGAGLAAFITELNSTGTELIYSTYLGGSRSDLGFGIVLDAAGDAFVVGWTVSTDFPVCPDNGGSAAYCASHAGSPAQSTNAGGDDAFVAELNATGTKLIYSTYLGGSGKDQGFGIALDAAGDAYVTGYTLSSNFPVCPSSGSYCASSTGSPVQSTSAGGEDVFVTELNSTGMSLIYSTYLGGSSDEEGNGIALDAADDAFVTGYTLSSNFPVCPDNGGTHAYCFSHTGSPVQASLDGSQDAFIADLSSVGGVLSTSTPTVTVTPTGT